MQCQYIYTALNRKKMAFQKNIDLIDSFEKIPVKIFTTPKEGSVFAAQEIANLIKKYLLIIKF